MAMRGLLGDGAPLSAASIARLRESWTAEHIMWKNRRLEDTHVVYLWVDGVYVKAGLEKDKAALLVAIGAMTDGTKRVLAVECGQRESQASWAALLRELKARGMNCPGLVMGGGALGIWAALAQVYPEGQEQRCWNHRMRNVLDRVGKRKQATAKELLSKIMYAPTLEEAEKARTVFRKWARSEQYDKAANLLDEDWERLIAYYAFPKDHWLHVRTTNIIESPFASVRLRTAASKRYKKVAGATVMIWKLLLVAEQALRKLDGADLLVAAYAGRRCADGVFLPVRADADSQTALAA